MLDIPFSDTDNGQGNGIDSAISEKHGHDLALSFSHEHDMADENTGSYCNENAPESYHLEAEWTCMSETEMSNSSSDDSAFDDDEFERQCDNYDGEEDEGEEDHFERDHADTDIDFRSRYDIISDWALSFKVKNNAVTALLTILQPHFPELPRYVRKLLGTVKKTSMQSIANGSHHHFGILSGILDVLRAYPVHDFGDEITFQTNVDGLPVFKSSNSQFWPMLGLMGKDPERKPFLIGLFHGTSKPKNAREFLSTFVDELTSLQTTGIKHGDKNYKCSVSAFICNIPARAFVKNVKSHSGYAGCDKCIQHGECNGKMTFPDTSAPLRTNLTFDEMTDEEHHQGASPLQGTGIGMVSQFPLDYMHLVCLGVMRRLLLLWMRGPSRCRVGSAVTEKISIVLTSMRGFIAKEFVRKPRALREINRWKATEFRQFLLYTGPVALINKLHQDVYKNFLQLHVGRFILVNPYLCSLYCDYAHDLLVQFVHYFGELYGRDMLVYNIHGLVHLANDVRKFGSLDNVSSFPFENFLQSLKKMVRKPTCPLPQIVKRMSELKGHKLRRRSTVRKNGELKKAQ